EHLVIDLAIDPALDDALDVAEVADHVALVERVGAHFDFGDGVVPVWVLAHAVVIEEAMAVTEIDTFGDRIHDNEIICPRRCCSPAAWTARCSSPTKRRGGGGS